MREDTPLGNLTPVYLPSSNIHINRHVSRPLEQHIKNLQIYINLKLFLIEILL